MDVVAIAPWAALVATVVGLLALAILIYDEWCWTRALDRQADNQRVAERAVSESEAVHHDQGASL